MKNDIKQIPKNINANIYIYPLRCRQSPRVVTSAALWISPHLQHNSTDTQKNLPHSICFLWISMRTPFRMVCQIILVRLRLEGFRGFCMNLSHNVAYASASWEYPVPRILFLWECEAQMISMSWADSYIR